MQISFIKKLSYVFNEAFKFVIIFLALFVWVRRRFDLLKSVLLTSCVTLILYLIIRAITSNKKHKKQKSNEDIKKREEFAKKLLFMNQSEILTLFAGGVSASQIYKKSRHFLTISNLQKTTILYPFYKKELFDADDLRAVYIAVKKHSPNKVIVCVHNASKDAICLANSIGNFDVVIMEQEEVYAQFGNCETAEKLCPFVEKKKAKYGFEFFVAYALNKKRAKGYFFSAFVLLFSSFFLRINIYYLIMSSILLLLAFVSLFNPRFNKTKTTSIFD